MIYGYNSSGYTANSKQPIIILGDYFPKFSKKQDGTLKIKLTYFEKRKRRRKVETFWS